MKIRNKLYKKIIKSKNNQIPEIKQAAFRKFQNKIADLLLMFRNILVLIRKIHTHYGQESMKLFI